MTPRILSSILILVIFAFTGLAQTQQGLVKIKGRYSPSGQVIPGPPLAGVSVKVKGRNAVLSKKNGTFQFPVPSAKFYLERVSFPGHRIADPDKLRTQYSYSKENPLEIAMEDIEQHAKDVEYAVTNMRREMRREIRKREDEIYRLREENKMQEKDFQEQIQKLHADAEKGEKLVMEMAEYFASIDFDKIDDQKRDVSALILKGELQKAKAMILRPGCDIEKEIKNILLKEEFDNKNIKQKEAELANAKAGLVDAKTEAEKTIKHKTNLADKLYSLHQVYALEFKNDSAAYCLERRAQLDTLNIKWQIEAGDFIVNYLSDYNKAFNIFQKAILNSESTYGEMNYYSVWLYYRLGFNLFAQGKYEQALYNLKKVLDLKAIIANEEYLTLVFTYRTIGDIYLDLGKFDWALEAYEHCSNILALNNAEERYYADLYVSWGNLYLETGEYDRALLYKEKALDIFKKLEANTYHIGTISTIYNSIGACYLYLENSEKALEYVTKAYNEIFFKLGKDHPLLASIYSNYASIYFFQEKYEEALIWYKKAFDIKSMVFGGNHLNVAQSNINIGSTYHKLGINNMALEYYNNAIQICSKSVGDEHPYMMVCYADLSNIYYSMGKFDMAIESAYKALSISKQLYGIAKEIDCDAVKISINTIISIDPKVIYNNPDILQKHQELLSQIAYVAESIPNGVASDKGISGFFYLLEFSEWSIDSGNNQIYNIIEKNRGKAKSILLLKDGIINQYYFEDSIGMWFGLKFVSPEEKANINRLYQEWKSKQQ